MNSFYKLHLLVVRDEEKNIKRESVLTQGILASKKVPPVLFSLALPVSCSTKTGEDVTSLVEIFFKREVNKFQPVDVGSSPADLHKQNDANTGATLVLTILAWPLLSGNRSIYRVTCICV